jgi:putative phosphoribosyl transferase
MFRDRQDAGRRLLQKLGHLKSENVVVLALPRGGLPVAEPVADGLGAPLDVVMVRKIGFPGQPELALAAVSNGLAPRITINEELARRSGFSDADIHRLALPELTEIRRRREVYLRGRKPLSLRGKTVVVVDDGLATGATMRAALRAVKAQEPAQILAAVPVGATDAIDTVRGVCDELVCLETPLFFNAVGAHYRVFDQVSDETVIAILDRHAPGYPDDNQAETPP